MSGSGGECTIDNRTAVDAPRKRAEGARALIAQAAGAEAVGHSGRGVTNQQRGLKSQGEVLDHTAGIPSGVGPVERGTPPAGRPDARQVGCPLRG